LNDNGLITRINLKRDELLLGTVLVYIAGRDAYWLIAHMITQQDN